MNEIAIKRLLLSRVFQLRKNQFTYDSLDKPQSAQTDTITTSEGEQLRRRVTLTAHGCKVATCTMCPLPDEAVSPSVNVTLNHWMNQITDSIKPDELIHTFTLFHNGNFFNDKEVPDSWRNAIYDYLHTTQIKEFVVESLPQYITPERIASAKSRLGKIKLVVAIGLQSSSELVRELCIASTCLGDTFERAIKLLHANAYDAQVFVMFKPAFLTTQESMYDLQESVKYCHSLGVIPTVCPMRIAPHTVVADLAECGKYEVPDLWDLYDALSHMGKVRVAASLFPNDADPAVIAAFRHLNTTGTLLKVPPSHSHVTLVPTKPTRENVLERMKAYLMSSTVEEKMV